MGWPAVFAVLPGMRRCSCCGGVYRRSFVEEVATHSGTMMCHSCARFRSGG